ncbi:pathogenicity island protein [Staphylococcus pseudintermedius]|uniref:pathogenicity island protein n=1 Tax=Staphylococcus pseudintermedius TaxID=283734 RepID=UPI0022E9F95E|nr:pathogenicity island protein [Staphylococcus pseudintermedius]MDA3103224.1 pathogenicity island protein [Staphylococcus pseudintermedius]MDK3728393.1 pathogenicity island protein [Staphylococcus pseudintermedius]MDK3812198.1 pathogenicity island protein [Staphylococcus pseudintermedius]MDK3828659.1 pathogenicity island protein [Staphylococcus pseudintermedius]
MRWSHDETTSHYYKDTKHNLLLNVSPQVFEQNFPEINNDVQIAVLEMDLSRITEIKNKKKVGS